MNLAKRVNLSGEDPYSLLESSENIYFREIKWNRENLSSLHLAYKAKDFFYIIERLVDNYEKRNDKHWHIGIRHSRSGCA